MCSKLAGNRTIYFCVLYWFALDYILIFTKSDLHLTQTFCFLGGYVGITAHISVSLSHYKLADIEQLAISFL